MHIKTASHTPLTLLCSQGNCGHKKWRLRNFELRHGSRIFWSTNAQFISGTQRKKVLFENKKVFAFVFQLWNTCDTIHWGGFFWPKSEREHSSQKTRDACWLADTAGWLTAQLWLQSRASYKRTVQSFSDVHQKELHPISRLSCFLTVSATKTCAAQWPMDSLTLENSVLSDPIRQRNHLWIKIAFPVL